LADPLIEDGPVILAHGWFHVGPSDDYRDAVDARDTERCRQRRRVGFPHIRREAIRVDIDAAKIRRRAFSPDGSSIVFASTRDGPYNLYQKLTSGKTDEELLLKTDESKYPWSWSSDGRFLLYYARSQKTNLDVWILPMQAKTSSDLAGIGAVGPEASSLLCSDIGSYSVQPSWDLVTQSRRVSDW